MMACPDMEIETALLAALRKVQSSRMKDDHLILMDQQSGVVARFAAQPLAEAP